MNAKLIIEKVLSYQDPDIWLSCDEIASQCRAMGVFKGTSGNSVGSRLPEMKLRGAVEWRWRERNGCKYKEWRISPDRLLQLAEELRVEQAKAREGVMESVCWVPSEEAKKAQKAAQESAGLDSLGKGAR